MHPEAQGKRMSRPPSNRPQRARGLVHWWRETRLEAILVQNRGCSSELVGRLLLWLGEHWGSRDLSPATAKRATAQARLPFYLKISHIRAVTVSGLVCGELWQL